MAHVFVAPHPDDVALSCGGLIASLRELGQNVTILTVFSGSGATAALSTYQREALGFGTKALWPATEAFNRASILGDVPRPDGPAPWLSDPDALAATQAEADSSAKRFWQRASWYRRAEIHNQPLADQPLSDDIPQQGALLTAEIVEAAGAGDLMAVRRLEDERYAYFAEASVVFLDLPDAVFRGYEGDGQLLGMPRPDDLSPAGLLAREIERLEPQRVYFPLGIGNHVDHQLMRRVGVELLNDARRWIMPGPEYAGIVTFYEDFPYAWWKEFTRLSDLPTEAFADLPSDVGLSPELADVTDMTERKITGISLYASQVDRLFGGSRQMADAVRGFGLRTAGLGGVAGLAERYWATERT